MEFYEDDRYFEIMLLVDTAIELIKDDASRDEVLEILKQVEDV